jgi:hypothetical protein
VEQEPHHRVLFENQYVRVLDVQIPPGDSLLYHIHSYDSLSVRISGGLVPNQMQGSEWAAATVKPGTVVFGAPRITSSIWSYFSNRLDTVADTR